MDGFGFAIVHSVKGVEIVTVKPNSQAAQKIFQEGDVIVEVNQHAVNSVGEFNDRIAEATKKEAKKYSFFLPRNGELRFAALPLNCKKPAIAKPPTAATVTKTPKDNNE